MRSKFEKDVFKYLEKNEIDFEYESMRIKYTVPETYHTYTPDFVLKNGVIIEAKGNFSSKERKKISYIIRANPDLDIRMLFMRNNWITKNKKIRYGDWCDKSGIKWAVFPRIPKDWFDS